MSPPFFQGDGSSVPISLNSQQNTVMAVETNPNSKVHGANMGPTWVLSAPDGPHVGPTNLAIREGTLRPQDISKRWTFSLQNKQVLVFQTLTPAWISNHMPIKVWDEITYPFLNFNGCNYTPAKRSWRGYTGFTLSVCLSVCGQNRVRSVSSTIFTGSIS